MAKQILNRIIILLCMIIFVSACSSSTEIELETDPTPNPQKVLREQQKKRFDDFALSYNAIDSDTFYNDVENSFSVEVISKYSDAYISQYFVDFADIYVDESGNYVGVDADADNRCFYYTIPSALYDNIIDNKGHCDGIIFKVNKIEPVFDYIYATESTGGNIEDGYVDLDFGTEPSYGFLPYIYCDLVDVYIENE